MPGFDDMLELEDALQKLGRELLTQKDLARTISQKHLLARQKLDRIKENLATLKQHHQLLKSKVKVVLLSEYAKVIDLIAENQTLLEDVLTEIRGLERKGKDTSALIPVIEARIAETKKALLRYGQVVPFRR